MNNKNPGTLDQEIGEHFLSIPTYLEVLFLAIFVIIIGQFAFHTLLTFFEDLFETKRLAVWQASLITIVFVLIFIVVQRYILTRPLKSFF